MGVVHLLTSQDDILRGVYVYDTNAVHWKVFSYLCKDLLVPETQQHLMVNGDGNNVSIKKISPAQIRSHQPGGQHCSAYAQTAGHSDCTMLRIVPFCVPQRAIDPDLFPGLQCYKRSYLDHVTRLKMREGACGACIGIDVPDCHGGGTARSSADRTW